MYFCCSMTTHGETLGAVLCRATSWTLMIPVALFQLEMFCDSHGQMWDGKCTIHRAWALITALLLQQVWLLLSVVPRKLWLLMGCSGFFCCGHCSLASACFGNKGEDCRAVFFFVLLPLFFRKSRRTNKHRMRFSVKLSDNQTHSWISVFTQSQS